MKIMNYKDYNCEVKRGKYSDNMNLALILIDEEDGSMVANVTVNTEEILDSNLGYVKNYSEGEGMLEALKKAGLVEEILGYKQLGYVTVPLVKFNLEDIEEL